MKPKPSNKGKKEFECREGCEHQYVETVLLGCTKCIRKFAPNLTKKQMKDISKIMGLTYKS
jgi:hypothetical protein